MENKWRAARYGLDGKMIDFGKQTEVPVRAADRTRSWNSWTTCRRNWAARRRSATSGEILEHGNGADRQLRVFHETGDLKKVVDYMIEETEYGLFEPAAPRRARHDDRRQEAAARTAVRPGAFARARATPSCSCLRIQPEEKVTLITDRACLEIGAALAQRTGAR